MAFVLRRSWLYDDNYIHELQKDLHQVDSSFLNHDQRKYYLQLEKAIKPFRKQN